MLNNRSTDIIIVIININNIIIITIIIIIITFMPYYSNVYNFFLKYSKFIRQKKRNGIMESENLIAFKDSKHVFLNLSFTINILCREIKVVETSAAHSIVVVYC